MRAVLWRRVLMLLFGVTGPPVSVSADFARYPLGRRVAAGLLGVSLTPAPAMPYEPPFGSERSQAHRLLGVLLAGAVSATVVFGGVWVGTAYLGSGDANAAGTGAVVPVDAPLDIGDCVVVDWPSGTRFEGEPHLTVDPTCGDGPPDGQVMAVVPADSAEEARKDGPGLCARGTAALRKKLADVRSFAVVPSRDTFEAAGRRSTCLVLGAHGPVYGPIGVHRKLGSGFRDTATMQKGDCLQVPSNRNARLASCAQPHDQEVLGFIKLGSDVTLAQARTQSDGACARDMSPRAHGFDPSTYEAGSWTSSGPWTSGTHIVVCTVRKTDGSTMDGDTVDATTSAP
ncbi:septum formation family protein [Streptomyces sp. cg40]|uniref:septum formation family protein n=1 Tax=Streptomyces sp. cg40 TaxID=3419764 RepID=UPI003D0265FB